MEGIVVLNLIEKIYNLCYMIIGGRIIIYIDNKTMLKIYLELKLNQINMHMIVVQYVVELKKY